MQWLDKGLGLAEVVRYAEIYCLLMPDGSGFQALDCLAFGAERI